MLIRFKAVNWKSFRDLEFSAVASSERLKSERVPVISKYRTRILPISAFYGGNASGKSNLFEALAFMRRFIVDGVKPNKPIGVKPYALNGASSRQPSFFEIELLSGDSAFRYSFSANRSEVLSETLTKIRTTREEPLFVRKGDSFELFGPKLNRNERLKFVGQGTQNNLLFLTNSVWQKCREFQEIYNWFNDTLVMIAPESTCNQYDMFANSQSLLRNPSQETLEAFDVGIEKIETAPIPWEQVNISPALRNSVEENLEENGEVRYSQFLFRKENGNISAYKLLAVHRSEDSDETRINFELSEESDGTRRLLDLLPALKLLEPGQNERVVFIDEIDRSLHHLLTKKLIQTYLDACSPNSRSQLFFTTHDALLMDQELLRRDEIQLIDKNDGRSELFSLSDFALRYDKDLLKSYLFGRFGGTPKLFN